MSSPDYSQQVKDIIDGLGDTPTPDEIYHAVRNYSVDNVVAAAASAAKAGGGGGGSQTLEDVLTEGNDGGAIQVKNIGDATDPDDAAKLSQVPQTLAEVLGNGADAGAVTITNLPKIQGGTNAVTLDSDGSVNVTSTGTRHATLEATGGGYFQALGQISGGGVDIRGQGDPVRVGGNSDTLGFYGVTPVAQQTGVTVDAAGIHAALVALGLITA